MMRQFRYFKETKMAALWVRKKDMGEEKREKCILNYYGNSRITRKYMWDQLCSKSVRKDRYFVAIF